MEKESLKKLQSLGYSKTKSLQALKDAGGNCAVALKILDNQQQSGAAKASVEVPMPKAIETVSDSMVDNVRKHPCIVQHKTCSWGKNCLLRDLPGDTCIHYFRGCCLYGSFCKKRHHVDDVSLSAEIRATLMNGTSKFSTGVIVKPSESSSDKQLVTNALESVCDEYPSAMTDVMPHPSRFNRIQGSDPTHTEFNLLEWEEQSSSVSMADAPKPFLEAARMQLSQKPHEGHLQRTVCSQSFSLSPTGAARRRKKHPCVSQFGSCKFGNECIHKDRDADVCVFFLNKSCNRGSLCKYRHETEAEYLQQFRPHEGVLATRVQNVGKQDERSRVQLRGMEEEHEEGAEKENNVAMESDGEEAELPPWERQPKAPLLSSFLPKMGSDEVYQSGCEETKEHGRWVEEEKDGGDGNQPCDDMELETLMRFLEVFPGVEPHLMLQVLRSADGDANYAAETLSKLGEFETNEDIVAFLSSKHAEEKELLQEAEVQSKHECFLTLCTLFPAVETSSIEAVLERCGGDYAEAYGALLCSTEKFTRQDYGSLWNGPIKLADEMRLEKICTMFPSIPREVIRTAFGAAEKDFARTVAALNEMTADILDFEEEITASPPAAEARRTAPSGTSPPPREELPPQLLQRSATREEVEKFCAEVGEELREMGDWRRVRDRAYIVNSCRLQVLGRATAAYLRGDGKTAKTLSRHGKELGAEYARLNRIAMVALEREQLERDPVSTLDLHGFHVDEVVEVLRRRVQLCVQKGIRRLTVVVGRGHHSRRGYSTLYPAVLTQLKQDPQFQGVLRVKSIKPAFFETIITTSGK